ncbi:MAG: CotH kinase family protein [Lachnospiraceae bacterium]|nr:CotH kinase family protein [Lachnospiraceae bacterium]
MKNNLFYENRIKLAIVIITTALIVAIAVYARASFDVKSELLGVGVVEQGDIDSAIQIKQERIDVYHYPIKYNGELLPYDWENNTLYIPQDISKKNFLGELTSDYGTLYFSDKVSVSGEDLQIDDYHDKEDCIKNNAIFTLYLIIDENSYSKYHVLFTGMPTISLTYDEYDSDNLVWTGNMKLIDPYHKKETFVESDCRFGQRGDSSSAYDKKSYNLTLDEKKSLLGLRTDDDWALVAMIEDNGYIHNKLCYDLWNEISKNNGVDWDNTVGAEYVEVFYDNTYVGLYLLTEKVDRKLCDLKKKDILYRLEGPSIDMPNPTTGEELYSIKYPKEYTSETFDVINRFVDAYSSEEIDYEYAKSLLNMNNEIDMNLYSMFISATDNWSKNAFFVATARDDYKLSEIMWDMNETFGDDIIFYENYITNPDMMTPHMDKLYKANPAEISKLMYFRWCELRDSVIKPKKIKGKVEDMISYMEETGALRREIDRWPEVTNQEWKMDDFYRYIDERTEYLDSHYKDDYEKYN